MSVFDQCEMLKICRNGVVAAVLGLGMMAGVAKAAPISPNSLQSEAIQAPIEKTVVVVHHRRRPVVVHHRRRHVVVHHRRRHVCWWRHGRRICRWR